MKKIITFDKSLEFKSMIGEITSISLEHNLKFIDQSNIDGSFYVTGTYKLTEASQIEDNFSFNIPVEISLPETITLDTSKIEIDDFNYEIENDDTLLCHIDVLIKGVEEIKEEVEEIETIGNTERECDGDEMKKLDDISIGGIKEIEPEIEDIEIITEKNKSLKEENKGMKQEDIKDMKEEKKILKEAIEDINDIQEETNVGSLFSSFKEEDETFTTYSVYIMRNNDTIEQIIDKYKIKRDDLENYNDLSNIQIGSKIIIPTCNE